MTCVAFIAIAIIYIAALSLAMYKQKYLGYKKSKAESEAPVNSYSKIQLKSMISVGGQCPSCLPAM